MVGVCGLDSAIVWVEVMITGSAARQTAKEARHVETRTQVRRGCPRRSNRVPPCPRWFELVFVAAERGRCRVRSVVGGP